MNKKLIIALFLISAMNTAIAGFMNPLPSGTIKNMHIGYHDSDTITISSGYCDLLKSYVELNSPTTLDLSTIPPTDDFVYIYISYAQSSGSDPCFYDSTTEPVWEDSLQGWYSGNDRCIGAIYIESGVIKEFTNYFDKIVFKDYIVIIDDADPPSNDWYSLDTTPFIPVNASGVKLYGYVMAENNSSLAQIVYGDHENQQNQIHSIGLKRTSIVGWLPFQRGSERDIDYYSLGTTAVVKGRIFGYMVER